jgi:hypothetical protein
MDRNAFYCLFVNANSLAELGLRNAESDIEDLLADLGPEAQAQPDEEFTHCIDELNFDAMDGLAFYDQDSESNLNTSAAQIQLEEELELSKLLEAKNAEISANFNSTEDSNNIISNSPDSAPSPDFDINIYMTNAYSHEKQLKERVDAAFEKSDQDQITGLLEQITIELPDIRKRLSGEQISIWLDAYTNDDEPVMNLIANIRLLDFL